MSDLNLEVPQELVNRIMFQMLLEIQSRQLALTTRIAQLVSIETGEYPSDVHNLMETTAEQFRLEVLESLYSKFGEIPPEVWASLNKKID